MRRRRRSLLRENISPKSEISWLRCLRSNIVIVVDDDGSKPLREGELAFHMDRRSASSISISINRRPKPRRCSTTLRVQPVSQGGAACTLLTDLAIYHRQVVLDLKDNDIYWCTADPGWGDGNVLRHYRRLGKWRHAMRAGFRI